MGEFRGVTFGGENVTPKNDGGLYGAHYGDGILFGCEMSIVDDTLQIEAGEFICGGRVIMVDGATNIDLSGRVETDGYIRVLFNIVLGNEPEYYASYVEYPSTTFPALTQENINLTGTTYQVQLAVIQESGGALSLYTHIRYSPLIVLNESGEVLGIHLRQDGNFQIGNFIDDAIQNGIVTNSADNTLLVAPNKDIILRPKGWTDNTNQFRFYPDGHASIPGDINIGGQQYGGHPVTPLTKTAETSLTGGHTIVLSATDLVSAGVYIVTATFEYKASSSSAHWPVFGFGTSASLSAYDIINQPYIANASERRITISGLYTGHTSCRLLASTQSSSITAVIKNVNMRLVRLS